jgi:hypothetical protein
MRVAHITVVFSLFSATALPQSKSVAQSITDLTQDVAALKTQRAASPGAAAAPGSPMEVKNASGAVVARIESFASGGLVSVSNNKSDLAAELAASVDGSGWVGIFPSSGGHQSVALLTTDGAGTSGRIVVSGPAAQFEVNGKGHDYAEVFDIADSGGIHPGSVVAEEANGRGLVVASGAYNSAVVGVIAGAGSFHSGMVIGSREDGSTDLPVATGGQVFVRISAESGPIRVGDLLVSSSTPGVAMRGEDSGRLTGTVIGKALQPYSEEGEGLIRMLVLNR